MKPEPTSEARSPKEKLILDCALKLMTDTGDAGLTLRKLADCAGMRLSNVQYYFNSRDDVLAAMVGRYFEECSANLVHMTDRHQFGTTRERIKFLVSVGLSHGQEVSDMCRAFREIWAISSRNKEIDLRLMDYYSQFSKVVVDFALPDGFDTAARDRLRALLVPYFEGYSITARSLPMPVEDTAEMITDLAVSVTNA
ncbi:HTH-type transcriptional repressor KstR (plasmid) [Roseovarius sp. THAF8]|nr:HTH-type transcriptional repressor KstR [Roseovarius sp. THAF8]